MSSLPESPEAECCAAVDSATLAAHFAVRHEVFVEEQSVFVGTDRDLRDEDPRTIHGVAVVLGEVVGAVRLYPLDDTGHAWQGDRLAVLAHARTAAVGADLVRFAVASAEELGGTFMDAHIQLPNVRFFQFLGWQPSGDVEIYAGLPHQPMRIVW